MEAMVITTETNDTLEMNDLALSVIEMQSNNDA